MAGGLKLYTLFVPEIKAHLDRQAWQGLKKILNEISPIELAEGWCEFNDKEKVILFRLVTANRALQLFEELEAKDQQFILENAGKLEEWLSPRDTATTGDGAAVAASTENPPSPPSTPETPAPAAAYVPLPLFNHLGERFLKQLQAKTRKATLPSFQPRQGEWPVHSAGTLMKHEFFCVDANWKANQTLERLQASTRLRNISDLNALYVTDKDGRLLGILSIRTLIAAPPDIKIAEIMWPVGLLKVRPNTDREEVAQMFRKFNLNSMPVVDHQNILIGTITLDDVLDVLHEEATEDIAKMAGTQSAELSQWKIWDVAKLRMPWLVITCLGQFAVAHMVHSFESTLSKFIALASFMPLIAAMGGNVGTQSSTISVRALGSGEWNSNDLGRAVKRDALVGILLGLIYGVAGAALAFFLYGGRFNLTFPLAVFLGIITSMTIAATIGAAAPFLFNRMGIDPATASGPLVTTGTDLISVTIYLAVATLLLAV